MVRVTGKTASPLFKSSREDLILSSTSGPLVSPLKSSRPPRAVLNRIAI
jgi:hypothetical protein